MTKDCRGLLVHPVSFIHGRGPVFYASLPYTDETTKGSGTNRAREKQNLIFTLWDTLAEMERPLWKHSKAPNGDALPIQVVHDPLGRPSLLFGECPGPAISFSKGGGKLWAAICGDDSDIGIDVAGPDEFLGGYPFHRVFHPKELQHTLRLTGGDLENAAALLWSVKEAVVKALGCAFHLVAPMEVTVCQPEENAAEANGGYTFAVDLSGKALLRFPIASRWALRVHSFPRGKIWLSIALLNRRLTGDE